MSDRIIVAIDSGSQMTKAVAVRDGVMIAKASTYTDFDAEAAAKLVLEKLLETAGLSREEVAGIIATGSNRQLVTFADDKVNEIVSAASGVHALFPDVRMLLDMGAEGSRVVSMDDNGAAKSYEVNDRCASGAGTFIETCARALEIKPEEMTVYASQYTTEIPMKAQCVVFVESEVISLIHQKESKANIAHGVHIGISDRIGSMFRRLGVNGVSAFIGCPAKNTDLVHCMEKAIGYPMVVPEDPEYIGAYGAALVMAARQ